jgi:cytochrome c oxidase subunit IV
VRAIWLSWAALLVLLGATVGGAFLPLGAGNVALALAIAAAKAGIVVFVFMELRAGPRLTWALAGAGFFWLMILFTLAGADVATRPVP